MQRKGEDLSQEELSLIYALLKLYANSQLVTEGYHDGDDERRFEPVSRKGAKALLKKLKFLIESPSLEKSEKIVLATTYGNWNRSPDDHILQTLDRALTSKQVVFMEYYAHESKAISKRNLSPYARNSKYMIGYCYVRKQIRKFKLSRIVAMKLLDEHFEIPPGFNKKEFL